VRLFLAPGPNEQPSLYIDTRIERLTETRSPCVDILNRVFVDYSRISPRFSQRHLPPTRKIPYKYREILAQRSCEKLAFFQKQNNVFPWFVILKEERTLQCRFRLAAVHEATSSSESVLLKRKNWPSFVSKETRNEAPASVILSLMHPDQGATVRLCGSLPFSNRGGIWFQVSQQQLPWQSSTSFSDHHKADSGIPNPDLFPAARFPSSSRLQPDLAFSWVS
jgi:hypothetical protein